MTGIILSSLTLYYLMIGAMIAAFLIGIVIVNFGSIYSMLEFRYGFYIEKARKLKALRRLWGMKKLNLVLTVVSFAVIAFGWPYFLAEIIKASQNR